LRRRDLAAALALFALGARAASPADAGPAALQRLYGDRPTLWLDPAGQPTRAAREALALLDDAQADGLDPVAYDAAALGAAAASPSPAWDHALSGAMLRYLRHLHTGRVDPAEVGWRLPPRANEHDWPALLRKAIDEDRVASAAQALAPALPPYRRLRAALARYRESAARSEALPLPAASAPLRPGMAYAALDALRERLRVLGDLGDAGAVSARYEGALVDAVQRFQARHGLAVDGVLGAATLAALNVPLARRVRQIELALERLRWLPHGDGRRTVAIDIPLFHLWALDAPAGDAPPLDMRVIVGRALDTRTPVLVGEMRRVIFRPYWNVPRSIVRNEILPALARDPAYLARHDMEIVRGGGDDAAPVAASSANVALLRDGALRLRQRPGPRNSLGLVKFEFPNDDNVYLHGTPARALFERTRRDFSHGCVRVAEPVALAQWALAGTRAWTLERIESAMAGTRPVPVELARPVRVVLFYVTALVAPGDDGVRFAEDIYGHDARLERALAARY
jgi:murein L,D-transpeptidase YcbB/YkuD